VQGWIPAALFASICIAAHYSLLRAASGKIGDTLGALALEGTAAVGIALSYAFGMRGPPLPTSTRGLLFSVASGLCISGASILMFAALRKGAPVASLGTIAMGGGVTIAALLAPFVFGEAWTARRAIGVALGIVAMLILSSEAPSP
jgi:uncharacterized membrane protein